MSAFNPMGQTDRDFELSLLETARLDNPARPVQLAWADFARAISVAVSSVEPSSGLHRIESERTRAVSSQAAGGSPGIRMALGKASTWLLIGALGGSALTAAFLSVRRGPSDAIRSNPLPALSQMVSTFPHPSSAPERVESQSDASVSNTPVHSTVSPGQRGPAVTNSASLSPGTRRLDRDTAAQVFAPDPSLMRSSPTVLTAEVSQSTLAAEVKLLDAARIACRVGAYDQALRLVESYHREFAHGVLGPDAEVVALEALADQGDRAALDQRAAAFLAKYPSDPHAAKVRRWAEQVETSIK